MPSNFLRAAIFAVVTVCASLAHAAESPGLFDALGKLLRPQATAGEIAAPPTASRSVTTAGNQRRVALVVGMSSYPSSALENPRYDAAAMDAALKRLGFDVETTIDATKAQLDVVLRRFGNRAEKAEVAALFYAGHGLQVDGHNYIVPIDAKPQTVRDLKRDMIKLDDIIDDMGQAKVKLVFFDACRDNPLARSFNRGGTRGLAAPTEASGTLISFATKHGNTASDGDEKNSPYTQALLAELANPDGVEIEALMKNVSRVVKKKTRGQQEPWKYGSLDADFYFIFTGPTTVNVQQAPTDPETETWKAAVNADTATAYKAYLDAYPGGRYARAAGINLEKLAKPAPAVSPTAPVAVSPAPTLATPAKNEDPETQFWNEVKASGAREYLDAYLKQYPKGKFVSLARVELKKLDDKEKAERAKEEAERKAALAREEGERKRAAEEDRAQKARDEAKRKAAAAKEQREEAERERQEAAQRKQDEERRKLVVVDCEAEAVSMDGKPLAGAAKAASIKRCEMRGRDERNLPGSPVTAEDIFWTSVKSSGYNPRELIAYVEAFPSGKYVVLAKRQMDAVRVAEELRKAPEEAARGLQWAESDNGSDINWNEAKAYCASKGSGWRLPTAQELQDSYRSGRPTPCGVSTCKVSSNSRLTEYRFWTNEPYNPSKGWYVNLENGDRFYPHPVFFVGNPRALCVRRP